MTRLAIQYGAVNLGQGFPNFDGPDFIKEAAIAAIRADANQYCPHERPARAQSRDRGAPAALPRPPYDPDSEVTVYSGAHRGHLRDLPKPCADTGDEVVLFEPFYDSIAPASPWLARSRRIVTLHAP